MPTPRGGFAGDGWPACAVRRRVALAYPIAALLALRPLRATAAGVGSPPSAARSLTRVGPGNRFTTLAQACEAVPDGSVVEVLAGDYRGDVAVWRQKDLELRAVGGRVRLWASGASAEGKAIWVCKGENILVDGFDFIGARVADKNGAGIRHELGQLTVRNCRFFDNENGILTSNAPSAVLGIEYCEFGRNGAGDGYSHNLYVGTIRRLHVVASYFHHALRGHLLKSRAAQSSVICCRLSDEADGEASYELEFPSGGEATVVGNIIQQGPRTSNPCLVAFAAENIKHSENQLLLVHNTLVNTYPGGGDFVRMHSRAGASALLAMNNLWAGTGNPGPLRAAGVATGAASTNVGLRLGELVDATGGDYRLRASALRDSLRAVAMGGGLPALAGSYRHPSGMDGLPASTPWMGALQTPGPG